MYFKKYLPDREERTVGIATADVTIKSAVTARAILVHSGILLSTFVLGRITILLFMLFEQDETYDVVETDGTLFSGTLICRVLP